MQTEMNVSAKTGLTVRDLVTTGVFTALFLVFFMIGGAFTAPNPIATFFMPAACAKAWAAYYPRHYSRYLTLCYWYVLAYGGALCRVWYCC